MASQRLVYRGMTDLADGTPVRTVEVWASGSTAVAFDGPTQAGVLYGLELGMTDDRRLSLTGDDGNGSGVKWEAVGAEHVTGRWLGAIVTWPDGAPWKRAEVAWSQYGVRVSAPGEGARDLPGATVEIAGGRRWIVDGDLHISADAARRACCGGSR